MRPTTSISGEEARAALLASLAGTVFVGVFLEATGSTLGVTAFGRSVGGGYPVGWLALLAVSAAFALVFVEFLSRTVDGFVQRAIAASSRHESLQRLLVPLLRRSALTVTAVNLGLAYGAVVAVAFHALAFPAWLRFVAGATVALPTLDAAGALAWVLYGGVLGGVYGQTMAR